MSKAKKIVTLLFCLIVVVLSCFTVSAQTISGTTTVSNFKVNSVSFIVTRSGTSYDGGSVSTTELESGTRLRLNLTSDVGTLKANDKVTVVIELYPNLSALRNSQNNVTGSFAFGMKADSTTMSSYKVYRESTTGTIQNADRTLTSGWGDYWTCNFNDASIGSSYDSYWIMFDYVVDTDLTTYARYIYLQDFDFYYQNAQEYETDRIIKSQEEQADKITQNQDENTQAIIDNEKELQEQEKQEASDTGDDGVNEISGVVPNDSDGFIDSIGNLVNAMSYNGTECNWKFPAIKIPAIEGVIPETVLSEETEIPFEYWINQIPPGIMTLVRALLTIALIVYCFKEMYSIISYILTLRGGGASE